jgi:hypothetical protein
MKKGSLSHCQNLSCEKCREIPRISAAAKFGMSARRADFGKCSGLSSLAGHCDQPPIARAYPEIAGIPARRAVSSAGEQLDTEQESSSLTLSPTPQITVFLQPEQKLETERVRSSVHTALLNLGGNRQHSRKMR